MDCCLQSSSSSLITIVDVHTFLDQVLCCLDGSGSAFFFGEQFFDWISIIGHVLSLDEEVDSGEVPHVYVDTIRLNELYEKVHFGIVQQSECFFIFLGRIVVGIHVVLVGLDETGPLSFHEIHNYKLECHYSF